MRKTETKGFTLVELIIVIAVIGVLAAILIPTFADVITKANKASDFQAVRDMNTAVMAAYPNSEVNLSTAIKAIKQAGYKGYYQPKVKELECAFSVPDKQFFLYDTEEHSIVFPEGITAGYVGVSTAEYSKPAFINSIDQLPATLGDLSSNYIVFNADIDLGAKATITTVTNKTLDLNGHTITCADTAMYGYEGLYVNKATVTICDTSDSGSGKLTIPSSRYDVVMNYGTIYLDNVTLDCANRDYGIYNCAYSTSMFGTMEINGGTIMNSSIGINNAGIMSVGNVAFSGNASDIANSGELTITGNLDVGEFDAYTSNNTGIMSVITVKSGVELKCNDFYLIGGDTTTLTIQLEAGAKLTIGTSTLTAPAGGLTFSYDDISPIVYTLTVSGNTLSYNPA